MTNNVVYVFTCITNPKIQYVGYTTRKLKVCINEHMCQSSPIGTHVMHCDQCAATPTNKLFRILSKGNSEVELRISEAIYR